MNRCVAIPIYRKDSFVSSDVLKSSEIFHPKVKVFGIIYCLSAKKENCRSEVVAVVETLFLTILIFSQILLYFPNTATGPDSSPRYTHYV